MSLSNPIRVSKASRSRSIGKRRNTTDKRIKVARIHSLSQSKIVPKSNDVSTDYSTLPLTKIQLHSKDTNSRPDVHIDSTNHVDMSKLKKPSLNNTSFNISMISKSENTINQRRHNHTALSQISFVNEYDKTSEDNIRSKSGKRAPVLHSSKEKPDQSKHHFDEKEANVRKKARRKKYGGIYGFCCSPCGVALGILGALLVLSAVAGLIVALLFRNQTTTTAKNTDATLTTTIGSSSTAVTTASTTASTVTTTTTTTTTSYYCGTSCLYKSWYDSSGGLAFWPFEGNYADVVSSYHGYSSSKLPSFVTGVFGQAIYLNQSGKQAMYTPYIPLRNVSFTVEAWIKPTGYPNPSDFSIVGLCPSQTTNYCLHINIRNTKLYFGFYFNDVAGATLIQLNKWIHTAFVFEVTTRLMTIYLNGVVDGQSVRTSSLLVNSGNFTIGTNEGVVIPNNYFEGIIDQLSINRRAKSACEILEIATLAAHFTFDLPTIAVDSSPNSINTTSSSISTIAAGAINQAVSFSGTFSSYFQGSGLTSLGFNNQAFSISLWIQPQALSGTIVHLSSSTNGTGTNCFSLMGFSSTGAIIGQVLTTSGIVATVTGPILPISSTAWVPIVQTWSTTNGLKLYFNGTLVSSMTASTFLGSGRTPNYLTLGGCLSGCGVCPSGQIGASSSYTGGLDDVRVYLRELTATDVCALIAAA